MSYDIYIGPDDFNYTSNVSALFYDHIPATENGRGGLHELNGLTGRQAATVLADAFERIYDSIARDWSHSDVGEPTFCVRYDAPNGWGSAVGALVFLARVMAACHAHPRSKVRISA